MPQAETAMAQICPVLINFAKMYVPVGTIRISDTYLTLVFFGTEFALRAAVDAIA